MEIKVPRRRGGKRDPRASGPRWGGHGVRGEGQELRSKILAGRREAVCGAHHFTCSQTVAVFLSVFCGCLKMRADRQPYDYTSWYLIWQLHIKKKKSTLLKNIFSWYLIWQLCYFIKKTLNIFFVVSFFFHLFYIIEIFFFREILLGYHNKRVFS